MSDRIKFLLQKRTSLKSQITNLTNLLDNDKLDNATLKLRIVRLTQIYHAFEDYSDELAILEPDEGHQNEFVNIQERFYNLAGRIENIMNAAITSSASSGRSSEEARFENVGIITSVQKRRIKLPEASLPTFDGKYENWLSFKNAFHNMIGSQIDLSDVDKLYYLNRHLSMKQPTKVKIFAIDGINFTNA